MNENLAILAKVDADYAREIENLRFRHKKANDLYKLLVFLCVLGLTLSLYSWGLDLWAQRRADQQTADARVLWDAELAAKEEAQAAELAAAQKSEEAILDRWASAGAKMLYGIRNFREKYNYSDTDYETYLQCVYNRYLYGNKLTDIPVIISQKDQFLGFSDTNPVLDDLYRLSRAFFEAKLRDTSLACDPSYRFAELTPQGIYLVDQFGADGYVRRWHA
jgi:hypothetical protein